MLQSVSEHSLLSVQIIEKLTPEQNMCPPVTTQKTMAVWLKVSCKILCKLNCHIKLPQNKINDSVYSQYNKSNLMSPTIEQFYSGECLGDKVFLRR